MENQDSIYKKKHGHVLTGILGALLGALIGTVLWVLISMAGYFYSIIAWPIAFLAGKGYDLLHGRPGKAKMITLVVVMFLSVCVGTAAMATVIMVQSYNRQIAEVHMEMNTFEQERIQKYVPTVEEYVQRMFATLGVQLDLVKPFLLGLAFAALGIYSLFWDNRKQNSPPDFYKTYDINAPKETSKADDTDKHLDV